MEYLVYRNGAILRGSPHRRGLSPQSRISIPLALLTIALKIEQHTPLPIFPPSPLPVKWNRKTKRYHLACPIFLDHWEC